MTVEGLDLSLRGVPPVPLGTPSGRAEGLGTTKQSHCRPVARITKRGNSPPLLFVAPAGMTRIRLNSLAKGVYKG